VVRVEVEVLHQEVLRQEALHREVLQEALHPEAHAVVLAPQVPLREDAQPLDLAHDLHMGVADTTVVEQQSHIQQVVHQPAASAHFCLSVLAHSLSSQLYGSTVSTHTHTRIHTRIATSRTTTKTRRSLFSVFAKNTPSVDVMRMR